MINPAPPLNEIRGHGPTLSDPIVVDPNSGYPIASTVDVQRPTEGSISARHNLADDEAYLGLVKVSIVGLSYYDGFINPRESVTLKRNPGNLVDFNAIEVYSVRHTQVGHIAADEAYYLAVLLDDNLASMEASVGYFESSEYTVPAQIRIYSSLENKNQVLRFLRKAHIRFSISHHAAQVRDAATSMPGLVCHL
eukprot:jgi/Mesen1/3664/ME000202S02754